VDVAKAERGQLGDGPDTGARLGFGAAEPLPDFGGQALDDVPGIGVAIERGVAQRPNLRIDRGTDRRQRRVQAGADDDPLSERQRPAAGRR